VQRNKDRPPSMEKALREEPGHPEIAGIDVLDGLLMIEKEEEPGGDENQREANGRHKNHFGWASFPGCEPWPRDFTLYSENLMVTELLESGEPELPS